MWDEKKIIFLTHPTFFCAHSALSRMRLCACSCGFMECVVLLVVEKCRIEGGKTQGFSL